MARLRECSTDILLGLVTLTSVGVLILLLTGCGLHLPPLPLPSPSPTPSEPPTGPTPGPPSTEPPPTPAPTPSPSPSASPTPEPTPSPSPSAPPTLSCDQLIPTDTGWSLLGCAPACAGGLKCDCPGDGCTFTLKAGSACRGDSTPRYMGILPNWKTCQTPSGNPLELWPECPEGRVERSEYPPEPAAGYQCADKTDWYAAPGVDLKPEPDGFGAKIKFPSKGSFKIKACRRGSNTLCTEKTARVQ